MRAHEWNGSDAANGDDPVTTHAIASLENAVRTQAARPTLGTPASTELLASLDALTSDRRARLGAASRQLPALYVAVLLLAGAALIVNAAALTLRSGRRAALLVGGLAAVIGLSLALLFALGTPWRGPITVSGQPIDAVVRDLTSATFTPYPGRREDKAARERPGTHDRTGSLARADSQTAAHAALPLPLTSAATELAALRFAAHPGVAGDRVPGSAGVILLQRNDPRLHHLEPVEEPLEVGPGPQGQPRRAHPPVEPRGPLGHPPGVNVADRVLQTVR